MSKAGQYVGQHLPPLPHESPFGVTARFIWMNQMSASAFRRLADLSWSNCKPAIGGEGHQTLQRFYEHMGWYLDPALTAADDAFSRLPFFFSDRLRICAGCAGRMYHSTWHQFLGLTICPLHGCPLQDTCSNCHQSLEMYSMSTATKYGFVCRHCGESLTGRRLDMGDHLLLRGDKDRMRRAFASCPRQSRWAHAVLDVLECADPEFPFASVNRWWPGKLAAQQIVSDINDARRNGTTSRPALTWLVWPVRSGPFIPERELKIIYNKTLGILKKWIIERYPEFQLTGDMPELFDRRNVPHRSAWPPEIMAYMLMRHNVELAKAWGLSAPVDGILCAPMEKLLSLRKFRWQLQAGSVQAMVIGLFAAYYWWVRSGCRRPRHPCRDRDFIVTACWQICRTKGTSMVAVVFPPIEGMPLGRFDPSPLRLNDAVEMMRSDRLYVRRVVRTFKRRGCFGVNSLSQKPLR